MRAKRRSGRLLAIFLICLFSVPCLGDEILFQDQTVPQTGVTVDEDAQSVTIRFPRSAIKSITRSGDSRSAAIPGRVLWQEGEDYILLKIPRRGIRIVPPQTAVESAAKPGSTSSALTSTEQSNAVPALPHAPTHSAGKSRASGFPANTNTQQALLREETGRAEGVIRWHGKPLQHSRVKIVLETYTGFSLAALKRMYIPEGLQSARDEIVLETKTDARGRYVFKEAPPGYYRLYWMPDARTGWIRRLREKPDFEVITATVTVANVPEK